MPSRFLWQYHLSPCEPQEEWPSGFTGAGKAICCSRKTAEITVMVILNTQIAKEAPTTTVLFLCPMLDDPGNSHSLFPGVQREGLSPQFTQRVSSFLPGSNDPSLAPLCHVLPSSPT